MRVQPVHRRFWNKVRVTDGCWLWTGALCPNGYGNFTLFAQSVRRERQVVTSHRMAWVLTHGEIPDGLLVLHRCDVRRCCNPDHLFLGTYRDNSRDGIQKRRMPRSVPIAICPRCGGLRKRGPAGKRNGKVHYQGWCPNCRIIRSQRKATSEEGAMI